VLGYPDRKALSGYRFRLALASVAPTPLRALRAEAILSDSPLTLEVIESAAAAAMNAAKPIDDVRSSAAYRKAMVRVLTRRAVIQVWNALNKA
jgi:carbon-monoxide dehydrogenase medium subunit